MTEKEKRIFWRIPIVFSLVVAIAYLIIYQKNGILPSGSHFDLFGDIQRHDQSKGATYGIINFPFEISRWFDILFTWLISAYITRMTIIGFKNISEEEARAAKNGANNMWNLFSLGVAGGVIAATICSVIITLIAWDAEFLMIGFVLIIISGLGAGLITGLIGEGLGIGFATTYGLTVCLCFGIINIAEISILLTLIFGIVTTLVTLVGVYVCTFMRSIFRKKNKTN